ncbi:hypothetical protein RSA11_13650 [Exiguobacterium indicum]|uniref:Type I restriction modification DNA specificity domain-containing protein n=1 Tax=Exiguobacterium indicum TaxID=296995 RepID=A0AAW3M9L8_9BACL|nr:restriction endonuclease subunit S [Exiguobacterium indicum]KTR25783.1 hypothetical protein RSA11_13650 [Exiguobacterium indicum]
MEFKRLGDIATFINGYAFKPEQWGNEGLPIIRIQNLTNSSKEINYYNGNINEKYLVKKGDILIAWSASLGVHEWYGEDAALNQHIFKVVFDKITIDKKYFKYMVSVALNTALKYLHGSTMKHLTKKYFDDIKIPVPSYAQQLKIRKTLDSSYSLIINRQSQIAALDELKKSVFLEMFGNPSSNKHNYPIKPLVYFYKDSKEAVKCGPFGSALKKDEYTNSGIPVWNMDNISKKNEFIDQPNLFVSNEKAVKLQNYNVRNGDIIISRAGTVGKMAVVNSNYEESLISTNLIRLRLNSQLKPEFLVWLIKIFGDRVCRMRTGSDGAFTHMNTSVLNSIQFPYPPVEEQEKFIDFLGVINKQKQKMLDALQIQEELYQSLLQKAFKGALFQEKV